MILPIRRLLGSFCALALLIAPLAAGDLQMKLRFQQETAPDSGHFHQLTRDEAWKPEKTAIIVCDMWDLHHCRNAVLREQQFAPRLNAVLKQARDAGVIIIHAPSGCMEKYADHPSRKRAEQTPKAADIPTDINTWCYQIPSEEDGIYPVDQSDGGSDDDPKQHAAWAAELTAQGLNSKIPWSKQTDMLTIDPERDYISDKGDEVWSILAQKNIDNVILTGVHTNMCVLGRPFGLRQLSRNGKNVVLMRDLTDTMYNPGAWPFVNHFTGTDLIVSHIEKFVCPTVTSDQIVGGEEFAFADDKRPHVVMVMAEDEYETAQTLPQFGGDFLGRDFRVSYVYGSETDRNSIPGLEKALATADVLLISVRRRALPPEQLEALRKYVAAGKPMVGIRTASHAFGLRGKEPPEGTETWEEFDAEVWGGNYTNHYPNGMKSMIETVEANAKHPILRGVSREPFPQVGSLYQTAPLAAGTTMLLTGTVEGKPAEPVAWTFRRADSGWSFYTSLGHKEDFQNKSFQRLLLNSIYWAAGLEVPNHFDLTKPAPPQRKG
ncbi:isochorismatase family protein [Blastopirellula sp. JC732]|uniref:Isochorismatase family protein n=1 Tax=Blastopirellula sediminis TaxID=2894196 RepID=A0A9X1MK02_9BACT|nr:isochorismatase family protein [Blastopirellula sediminis]MCC9609029.1 isochorismatase family protein [Blastopirellula sediminis]MCC9628194.1 isochorismatase family protein [Blastopirellula sediminis]